MADFSEYNQNETDVNPEVKRYLEMLKSGRETYFDIEELEVIIYFYLERNDYAHTRKVLDYALKLHPNEFSFYKQKIGILLELKRFDEAIKLSDLLLRDDPQDPNLICLKAEALAKSGQIENACQNFDLALTYVEEDLFNFLHNIGILFLQLGIYDLSLSYLQKAEENNEYSIGIHFELGFCYEKIKQYQKSIDSYMKFIKEEPFTVVAWYNIGISYDAAGQSEKALEAYEFAIAVDPEYYSAYYNKAKILCEQGKYNEAISCFEEIVDKDKDKASVYFNIGECYEYLKNFDQAFKYYQKTILVDENYSDAWLGIASVLFSEKKYSECRVNIYKAIQIDPKVSVYWFIMARVSAALNVREDALKCFKKAIELSPEKDYYWYQFSDYYEFCYSYKVIKMLKQAARQFPQSSRIHYCLAYYYFRYWLRKTGRFYLEKALVLNPKLVKEFFRIYPKGANNKKIKRLVNKYTNNENSDT
jgi:tetratricopeptide (TPR) repeat protein